MIDLAVVAIAVAFVVLVGYIVPAVIQVRKTATEAERLLLQVNAELPELLKEMKQTNENVRVLSEQAREGVGRASVLMHAIGDVGETVNQVHGAIRGQGTTLMKNLASVLVGMRAMVLTVKNRVQNKEGR
ncbi:MAG: DUF948 domain-containing protein [Nitrospira sp.]|nr:DUF948 domain-containing protein [Nitrospira sp.]